MSARNRKQPADPLSQYPSPPWTVESLLTGGVPLPPLGKWLEPCAGAGSIIKSMPDTIKWDAVEIDGKYMDELNAIPNVVHAHNSDFLDFYTNDTYDAVMTNPPYPQSFEIVEKSLSLSENVIMLLSINWLGSIERTNLLKVTKPDVYIITPRPAFKGTGTDATEYAWFIWSPDSEGRYFHLPTRTGARKKARQFKYQGKFYV